MKKQPTMARLALFIPATLIATACLTPLPAQTTSARKPIVETIKPFAVRGERTISSPGVQTTESVTVRGLYDFDRGLILRAETTGKRVSETMLISPDASIDESAFQSVDTVEGTRGLSVPPRFDNPRDAFVAPNAREATYTETLPRSTYVYTDQEVWRLVETDSFSGWSSESAEDFPYPILEAIALAARTTGTLNFDREPRTLHFDAPQLSATFDETGVLLLEFTKQTGQDRIVFKVREAELLSSLDVEKLLEGIPDSVLDESDQTEILMSN